MNNDKRIILAIALYAAVITMVLHTIGSEAHQRFISTKQSAQVTNTCESTTPMWLMDPLCTETSCYDQEINFTPSNASIAKEDESDIVANEQVNG